MSQLTLPQTITVTPAVIATSVTIERLVDLPTKKVVRAFLKELPQPLTIWEGAAYDAIGNWTQEQAEARIIELLS